MNIIKKLFKKKTPLTIRFIPDSKIPEWMERGGFYGVVINKNGRITYTAIRFSERVYNA